MSIRLDQLYAFYYLNPTLYGDDIPDILATVTDGTGNVRRTDFPRNQNFRNLIRGFDLQDADFLTQITHSLRLVIQGEVRQLRSASRSTLPYQAFFNDAINEEQIYRWRRTHQTRIRTFAPRRGAAAAVPRRSAAFRGIPRPRSDRTPRDSLYAVPIVQQFRNTFRGRNGRFPTDAEVRQRFGLQRGIRNLPRVFHSIQNQGSILTIRTPPPNTEFTVHRNRVFHLLPAQNARRIPISQQICDIEFPFFRGLLSEGTTRSGRPQRLSRAQALPSIRQFLEWILLTNVGYALNGPPLRNDNPYPGAQANAEYINFQIQMSITLLQSANEPEEIVFFNYGFAALNRQGVINAAQAFIDTMLQSFKNRVLGLMVCNIAFVIPRTARQRRQEREQQQRQAQLARDAAARARAAARAAERERQEAEDFANAADLFGHLAEVDAARIAALNRRNLRLQREAEEREAREMQEALDEANEIMGDFDVDVEMDPTIFRGPLAVDYLPTFPLINRGKEPRAQFRVGAAAAGEPMLPGEVGYRADPREEEEPVTYIQNPGAGDTLASDNDAFVDEEGVRFGDYEFDDNFGAPFSLGASTYQERKATTLKGFGITQKFFRTSALMEVPASARRLCFPMAFMRSECVYYRFEAGKLVDIEEGAPIHPATAGPHTYVVPYAGLPDTDHSYNQGILLFNPYRARTGGLKVPFTEWEIAQWESQALLVNAYVGEKHGEEVDYTLSSCIQIYADVFQVVIRIYHVHSQGKRDHVFLPRGFVWGRSFRTVAMLLEPGVVCHIHAITHLRGYVKKQFQVRTCSMHQHCIFCDSTNTNSRYTPAQGYNHMNECGVKGFQDSHESFKQSLIAKAPRKTRNIKKNGMYLTQCCICSGIVEGLYHEHVCEIQRQSEYKHRSNEQLFVYDFECMQDVDPELGVSVHKMNLVCMQGMYAPYNNCFFYSMEEFMTHLLTPDFQNCVFLAHNGGKYDVQFILRYLEDNQLEYTFVPCPSSSHRFMSLTITGFEITFLDFIFFCPGSLRGIAQSFNLETVKGHFPHLFSTAANQDYKGPLPLRQQEEDFWLEKNFRSEEEKREFEEWYQEASETYCTCPVAEGDGNCALCGKPHWVLQEELLYYCEGDVRVLALACQAYREQMMHPETEEEEGEGVQHLDPFAMLTLAQVALHTFLISKNERVIAVPEEPRYGTNPLALTWLDEISALTGKKILHRGNHLREYYDTYLHMAFDGYCPETKEVFWYIDCHHYACPTCYRTEEQLARYHPSQGRSFRKVQEETQSVMEEVCEAYGTRLVIMYHHDYEREDREVREPLTARACFYGGRTEVFSPYANRFKLENEPSICYHDVCSLYPYVCATQKLPIGVPTFYTRREIQPERLHPDHPDKYFGFVQCHVTPNPNDRIGLLPTRAENGRLQFDVEPKEGCWGTEELYLAIRCGYVVNRIFTVAHWGPGEASDTALRGYIDRFLRDKCEAEGWVKLGATNESPTEEEKVRIQARLLQENGGIGKIRPSHVAPNKVKRALAKLRLNTLWGKFAQKNQTRQFATIHSYRDFCAIWYNSSIPRDSIRFREIGLDSYKVEYMLQDGSARPNARSNVFLASKVTEWARCILHEKILTVGPERVLYCDTDSVIFLWPTSGIELTGIGLGQWTDETGGVSIDEFYALAPKFYITVTQQKHAVRAKGVILTSLNKAKLNPQELGQLLWGFLHDEEVGLQVSHNLIQSSKNGNFLPYGTMYTIQGEKTVRPVISKRVLAPVVVDSFEQLTKVDTYPIGYRMC